MTDDRLIGDIVRLTSLPEAGVGAVLRLLDDGATIPFIARYRKEATGELDEVQIAAVAREGAALRKLYERREYVLRSIDECGKLTPELERRINSIVDATELEDIFAPYRPRRRTRAAIAREMGLEPLAAIIMAGRVADPGTQACRFVKGDVHDTEAAISGACDIIAEWISDNTRVRRSLRTIFRRSTEVRASIAKGKEAEASNYSNYSNYSHPLRNIPSHNYLALRRGERDGLLKISLEPDSEQALQAVERSVIRPDVSPACAKLVRRAAADSYRRLLRPSLENEIAAEAKQKADREAIALFAGNLEQLLLAPPIGGKRILAIDPGYRTGCKVVCLDATGTLLHHDVIYPVPPREDRKGAESALRAMQSRYKIDAIAVGNGTAGRETERFVRSLGLPVSVHSVDESGASVYSASPLARAEFPDQDVTVRGAVSIGRRLLDPMAELVKIDPQSIGVGQYQHDVDAAALKDALDFTVTSCVNRVGVNINTASARLLSYVSGIGPALAEKIVEYRSANGDFRSRTDLKKVPRIGGRTFEQCAGFLRIPGAENVLDNTAVHPLDYKIVERMASDLQVGVEQLAADSKLIDSIDLSRYVTADRGLPTLRDIISELRKPGRDPRCEEATSDFAAGISDINDLAPGMELEGIVCNITAFGVFVDIGLKQSGLVHVSQLSDRFVSSPADVVKLRSRVRVRVIEVDFERKRISLTMKGVPQ